MFLLQTNKQLGCRAWHFLCHSREQAPEGEACEIFTGPSFVRFHLMPWSQSTVAQWKPAPLKPEPSSLLVGLCSQVLVHQIRLTLFSYWSAKQELSAVVRVFRIAARHAPVWGRTLIQHSPTWPPAPWRLPAGSPPDLQSHEELLCFNFPHFVPLLEGHPDLACFLSSPEYTCGVGPQDWLWLQVIKTGISKQVSQLLLVIVIGKGMITSL